MRVPRAHGAEPPKDKASPSGLISRFNNYIGAAQAKIESLEAEAQQRKSDIAGYDTAIKKPFKQQKDLDNAVIKHRETQRKLMKATQLDAVPAEQREAFMKTLDDRKESLDKLGYGNALKELEGNSRLNAADEIMHSQASVVEGTPKGIPVALAQKIANRFMQNYNNSIPLKIKVVENQEDIYGPQNTIRNIGRIKGGYHPRTGVFVLAASNLQNIRDAEDTIRHEILGHYGLNTFK